MDSTSRAGGVRQYHVAMRAALLAKRLALAVGAPVALLATLEGALRLRGHAPRSPLAIGFGNRDPAFSLTEEDRDLIWRLVPNLADPGGGWEFSFSTNALGLRGDLPPREKDATTFRVICLGDSTAFGNVNTYPDELARVLRTALPGRTVEVLNGGIPGFSARQGFELFARDLIGFRPDLVTWCFGFNNSRRSLERRSDDGVIDERKRGLSVVSWLVRRTALGAWIATKIAAESIESSPDSVPLRVDPERFADLTALAAKLASDAGAKFVAIEQPHAFDRMGEAPIAPDRREQLDSEARRVDEQRAALEARCKADGIPFVPMHRYFAALEDDDYFIGPCPDGDVVHPSPIGLRYFAERLAADLGRLDLLPGSVRPEAPDSVIAPPAFVVIDLDHDGDEELLAATTRDGVCELAIFEPRSGGARFVPLGIETPTESTALSYLPALSGAIVLAHAGRDGTIVARSLDLPGRAANFGPIVFATAPGITWVRAVAVDLEGDDEPEYALECGPTCPPFHLLLDERLAMLGAIPNSLDSARGSSLVVWPYDGADGIERLAISGVVRGLGVEILFGARDAPPRARPAHYLVLDRPCATFYVRGRDRPTRRIVWRAPALFIEDGRSIAVSFPWGAARCDPDAPRLGISTLGASDSGELGVIVASLSGRRLESTKVDESGPQPKSITVFPEKP